VARTVGNARGGTWRWGDLVQSAIRHVVRGSQQLLSWRRARRRRSRAAVREQVPFLLHRRPDGLRSRMGVTGGESADDRELVERIVTAYRRAASSFEWDSSSMWAGFFEHHHTRIHQALMAGDIDAVTRALRDPGSSNMFYGFDSLGPVSDPAKDPYAPYTSLLTLDRLIRFAEALGAIPLDFPEGYLQHAPQTLTADEVIESIEAALGLELSFPAPFPGERGFSSRRGVVAVRALDALYQAWRVSRLVGSRSHPARVVEIGGGLGRTALYARTFGLVDYTLVDLPITAVSSAYFLGRTLGPDSIVCFGEEVDDADRRIRLLPPEAFFATNAEYDLVLNVDSLPEVGRETARRYLAEIAARACLFLSINHEAGEFTVRDLLDEAGLTERTQRFPSWMRPGYVEELLTKPPTPAVRRLPTNPAVL
jgi:hypothetical protein